MPRKPLTDQQKERKRERDRASSLLWRANNPEKVKAKNERYRAAHPDADKVYYETHREQCKEASRTYAKANPEVARAKSLRGYYARKERGQQLRGDNPEATRLRNTNRRALTQASGERLPRGFLPTLLLKQKGRCAGCGADIRGGYHTDHVTPLAKGGEHRKENIQLLCPACNMTKHAKDPIAWRQSLGQLI